jgi:DNA repair protein RadA
MLKKLQAKTYLDNMAETSEKAEKAEKAEPSERIEDLPGVGEKIAEKLKEAGYTELMSIAASSAGELSSAVGIGEDTAGRIIAAARGKLKMGFETGIEVLKRRENIGKITTGSKALDELLGGGVETQAITEAHGAFGCLTADAKITLANGQMMPIGYIANGLHAGVYDVTIPVISFNGNSLFKTCATKLHVYDCDKVFTVNLKNGMRLSVTGNHPLMTEYGWKYASKLSARDNIKIVADNIFPKKYFKLSTRVKLHKNASTTIKIDLPDELTPELAEIIAYVLGEGWYERECKEGGVTRVCFTSTDKKMRQKFREIVLKVFKKDVNTRYRRENSVVALAIDAVMIGEFLKQFDGLYQNAKNKYVPEQVFASPKDVVSRFLAALYDCEGSVKVDIERKRKRTISWKLKNGSVKSNVYSLASYGRAIELRSASRRLLEGVQILLTKFGIRTWMSSDVTKKDDREFICYKLHITDRSSIENFYRQIGIFTIRLRGKIERAIESYKRNIVKNVDFVGIDSINIVNTPDGKVYDLEVPYFHNFLSNNILSHNSGKTQLSLQLAVNVQLPREKGGIGGKAIFIDTEQTFRPERVQQIAHAAGLDPKKALENIFMGRAYNSDHQVLLAEKAADIIKKENVKLLVIDSLTSAFRSDYTGRGTLANRQQKLNRHLHHLQRLADIYNLAVYVTNQVMSRPDILFGDPTAPIGGHVLGHQATFRVYLRKSKGEKRIAKLIDSPNLPEAETVFAVTAEGIRDAK